MGYLQLIERTLPAGSDESRRYTEEALHSAHRLRDLVAELTEIGRVQSGHLSLDRRPLNLADVVRRAVELVQVQTPEPRIEIEITAEPVVDADEGRIEQVLLNLLTNAMSYAKGSERIDVKVQAADKVAEVQVRDYGPGIPAAALPHLFSRFYRVVGAGGARQGGLGLGLYISREIVAGHGGTLEVSSVEGEGATFTICLPIVGESQ